ncbi:MAG: EAL domain-containing protein [Hyphomicrobiales bacterium]|nr:EAL domain-containing protein [Hyphomicrobiales bacterium]
MAQDINDYVVDITLRTASNPSSMFKRPTVDAAESIPANVRRSLVESLFADSQTMVLGALATSVSALLIMALTRSAAPIAVSAVLFGVVAVRLYLIREYQSRSHTNDLADVQWLERSYVLSASSYLLSIGLLTLTAFAVSNDPFLLTLTASGAITHALSIAVRNFAIRTGVGLQLSGVAIPLAAAFIIKGGMFPLMIPLLLVPLCIFIYGSASRLRNILMSEIAFRNESERIANQFDFAINNMSHGMCMVSAEKRILVSNAKFSEFLALERARPISNVRFEALMRLAKRRAGVPQEAIVGLFNAFDAAAAAGRSQSLEFETASQSFYEVTITPNSRGGWVVVVQDVTAKRNADRAIDRMAHFDSVTNLRNRRSFELALAEALSSTQSGGAGIDVMFLDLDDFKQVNDSLGHRTGDKLLVEIASRLHAIIGPRDVVARWGGDEFVILHHHAPGQLETHDLAKRIIDEINRAVVIDGAEVIVGASIGSASAPDDGLSPDALLSKADIALYAAKADGRRVWRAFEQEMDAKIQIRRLIELELRAAVATDAIEVYFQPIVSVATRQIVGFEALARWRSALLGPVSPAEFIPIVEEIGLMEEMGAAMLRRACKACAGWPEEINVSVNLSSTQFRSGQLEKTILSALKAANLAPERLDLEITESILLEDRGDTRRTLQDLRAQGLRVSLDDFGTGYSSLSYLLSFPLDRIKIDRSFTMGLGIQERASVLVEGVSAMSRRLGMSVLIEGVETPKQLRMIESLGTIAEAQGYLFSRPVPEKDVAKLLRQDFRVQAA